MGPAFELRGRIALVGAGRVGQEVGWRRPQLGCVRDSLALCIRKDGEHTVTLCCPVRLGASHNSWVSDTVRIQGVEPMSTV